MGTSLSGLTPATTFDGLLKTSDNEPLDGTLKTISDGSGVDSVLQLSNSALQVNGDLNIGSVHQAYQDLNDLIIKGNSGSTYLKYYTNNGNNLTNQFGVGNFLKYATAIGESVLPNTSAPMLRIKGSGATSATTSLLVQNSAGTDLFKVQDNGQSQFFGIVNFRDDQQLMMQVNPSAGIIDFNPQNLTYDTRFRGDTTSNLIYVDASADKVGMNTNIPTAQLHIKGSGNDNTTTSLLVQNSDAADILKVTDDRNIETYDATGNVISQNDAATSTFVINPSLTSDVDFRVAGGGGKVNLLKVDSGLNSVSIGTGGVANTRFVIKGDGATSATTALLVQNSAGTDLLKVTDDGATTFIGSVNATSFNYSSVSSLGLNCRVTTTNPANPQSRLFSAEGNNSVTSKDSDSFSDIRNFTPTSGSALFTSFAYSGTINQTGTANGITRGVYINPTLTSAVDYRAIETTAGNVVFGNLPTSATGLPTGAIWNDGGTLKIA